MTESKSVVELAAEYAEAAHASIDQRRKYSNEPYIVHPRAVATIVATVTEDQAMIAAAWLHDVVEDTPVSLVQIEQEFGADIARLVNDLTNVSRKSDGNREYRESIDRKHTAKADPRAKTIKLADLIDNLTGIVSHDPGFARIFLAEKERLLTVLNEGDCRLYEKVRSIIAESWLQLDSEFSD